MVKGMYRLIYNNDSKWMENSTSKMIQLYGYFNVVQIKKKKKNYIKT